MSGPAADASADWSRLDPLSAIARALILLRGSAFALIAVIFGGQSLFDSGAIVFAILLLIIAANVAAAFYEWRVTRYLIGDSDVRVEKGLIARAARSVPYERIQDVSLEQALIPRLLGLVEVRFETGAGGKDELKLAYVSQAEGERLRRTVRARAEGAEQGSVANDMAVLAEDETGTTLFAMDLPRLITFGMFEFSLVVFALLIGAAQQLDFLLPFDIWDMEGWEGRMAGSEAYLSGLDMLGRALGIVFALGGLAILGFATGIFRTVTRDYGFLLEETPRGFRRRRGLLTRTDVVMPRHRVQAVTVSTRFLRRLFGWHGLSFISLAQDSGSANHDVAPFATMAEIAPIAAAAGFPLPETEPEWHRPSADYFFVRALVGIMVCIVCGVVATTFVGSIWPGMAFIALAAFLALRAHYLWRVERHALGDRQVLSNRGWLAPTLVLASRIKLHSAEVAQGPFGRWLGYADLNLGLAGGVLSFHGLKREEAFTMRRAVLESIAEVDFAHIASS
mgnify:CR=1 FL=1